MELDESDPTLLPSIEITRGELDERSRSLSPGQQQANRCLCYNCNVSELIMRSHELPVSEQLNFRTYFVRSLSHKFSNCSCYSLEAEIGGPVWSRRREHVRTMSWPTLTPGGRLTHNRSLDNLSSPKCLLIVSSKNHNDCCTTAAQLCRDSSHISYQHRCSSLCHMRANIVNNNYNGNNNQRCKRYAKLSTFAHPHLAPKLQQQRSFSSPDTRPSIIQPDPTCTARRHRHSISGQMSYFKLLGYNVSKKLTASANSLFSTAVISGSSSAPNLKDMVPPHASAVAGKHS